MNKIQAIVLLTLCSALCSLPAHSQQVPPVSTPTPNTPDQPSDPSEPLYPLPANEDPNDTHQLPAPAGRGPLLSSRGSDSDAVLEPDTRSLSSAETPGLGSLRRQRVLFNPVLRFSQSVDMNRTFGNRAWTTAVGGNLAFDRHWSRHHFGTHYDAGQAFQFPNASSQGAYHTLAAAYDIKWSRVGLRFRDDLSVAPEASFGMMYAGLAALYSQPSSSGAVSPLLLPSETILAGRSKRINNSTIAEVDYALTRRTTITLAGGYSLLHFPGAGFFDSRDAHLRMGYNYALDAKNAVALIYDHSRTRYPDIGNRLHTHLLQAGYGRKVTGRLAFQLSGGPQLYRLRNFGPLSGNRWGGSVTSGLLYELNRTTGATLSYYRGVTAGSGVFIGAITQSVTASLNRQMTRRWLGVLNAGFARNKNLAPVASFASRYDNWFGNAMITRQVGSHFRVAMAYGFQGQVDSAGSCPVAACGLPGGAARHQLGASVEWHPRAIRNE
jgi:hypothetical protein